MLGNNQPDLPTSVTSGNLMTNAYPNSDNTNIAEKPEFEILQDVQIEVDQECKEKSTNMNTSHLIEEDDTSSSDLKWDTMSITSVQSGMTRFDTIEDVSHAIGKIKNPIIAAYIN